MDATPSRRGPVVAVVALVLAAGVVGVAGITGLSGVAGGQSSTSTLYVDAPPGGPCVDSDDVYRSIQAAVDAAAAGDRIVVCSGLYDESVAVDERLTIEGNASGGPVILTGGSGRQPALTVRPSAAGTVIEGVTVRGPVAAGVSVESAADVAVRNTTFDGVNGPAVEVTDAPGVSVRGIDVGGREGGVSGENSTGLTVTNATFDVEGTAVRLDGSDGALVRDVEVTEADRGVVVDSSAGLAMVGTTVDEIDGPAVTLRNVADATVEDLTVTESPAGVLVEATDGGAVSNVTVRTTTVEEAEEGVRVVASGDGTELAGVTLSELEVSEADRGIGLTASEGATLADAVVERSTVEEAEEQAVEVATTEGNPAVRNVTLADLTVEDSEGGILVAAGAGVVDGVTLRDSSVTAEEVAVALRSEATLRNATVFRNRITGSGVGVLLDGNGPGRLGNVAVRQNLVRDSEEAGVLVTEGTEPTGGPDGRGLRVTRNAIRENEVGIASDADSTLAAWLNHWGDDGPDEDDVSGDVDADPWLGQEACPTPAVRGVTDGTRELYGESVARSQFRAFCAWDRAPLALRADPGDAAMSVENLALSYDLPGTDGPVAAGRQNVSVYERGERFDLAFGAGEADAGEFAGRETQLVVLHDPDATDASFDVGFEDRTGETVLRSDAGSATVRRGWGTLDESGELTGSFEPARPGSYTFVLVASAFGRGLENGSDPGELRLDGGASVVGFETVQVRETAAS
jgi:nitrous oxidase accessory protein NosD